MSKRYIKMKRWMKRPSSVVFPELRPSFRLISKGEAKICQQCQAQLMEGTRFLLCPQCETRVPRNFAYGNPEYQEAIEHYTEAIHLDPNHSPAYYSRGIAYHNLGEHQRAIQDYDKAIQLDPDYALAYGIRGSAYYCLGQYQRAVEDLDKAIQLDPTHYRDYYVRSGAYEELGQYERSDQDFDKAEELDPDYDECYVPTTD